MDSNLDNLFKYIAQIVFFKVFQNYMFLPLVFLLLSSFESNLVLKSNKALLVCFVDCNNFFLWRKNSNLKISLLIMTCAKNKNSYLNYMICYFTSLSLCSICKKPELWLAFVKCYGLRNTLQYFFQRKEKIPWQFWVWEMACL